MAKGPLHPRDLGLYITIAQVGLEMVVPLGVGIALDHYLNWAPWATICGAVLGLVVGITHLVALSNRHDGGGPGGQSPQEKP